MREAVAWLQANGVEILNVPDEGRPSRFYWKFRQLEIPTGISDLDRFRVLHRVVELIRDTDGVEGPNCQGCICQPVEALSSV